MKKYLMAGLIVAVSFLSFSTPGYGKSGASEGREQFVNIDTKQINFPHGKHQRLVTQMDGESCKTCHHKQRPGRYTRKCRRCHYNQKVISKGKYGRAGQKLSQKRALHMLCRDCHKKMLKMGYKRPDGSAGNIPSKCHHCHSVKINTSKTVAKIEKKRTLP